MIRNYYEINNGTIKKTVTSDEAIKIIGVCPTYFITCCSKNKLCKGFRVKKVGSTSHHGTHTRLYKIWGSMKERCYRIKHSAYKNYGGRGITVCDEWKNDFRSFKNWAVNNGYSDDLTLDRIDVNGNYEPSNCRWTDMKTQSRNKRTNRIIKYKGKKYTLIELAEKSGLNKTTLKERLNAGWSVEVAVTKPLKLRKRGYRPSKGFVDDFEKLFYTDTDIAE